MRSATFLDGSTETFEPKWHEAAALSLVLKSVLIKDTNWYLPMRALLFVPLAIQWAADHNQLEEVGAVLRALPEDRWVHFGEV